MDKCGHCHNPAQGYAMQNDTRLCHEDGYMDCYTLVTSGRHSVNDSECAVCQEPDSVGKSISDLLDYLEETLRGLDS